MSGCWDGEHTAECQEKTARREPTVHWVCFMPWHTIEDVLVSMIGGGWGGYWYCKGCGNPQLGEPPWKGLGVTERCRPCGPGRGYVPCPATHALGKSPCVLCRDEGWLMELGPAT